MSGTDPDGRIASALAALAVEPPKGFADAVLARVGLAPDSYAVVEGPVGPLYVAFNDNGVCHVRAASALDGGEEAFAAAHRARFGRGVKRAATAPAGVLPALRKGRAHGVRFDLRGLTPFERDVLGAAAEIPPGEVRPYGWIAARIGRARAVRAVGNALGRNPVPVLIPCHRVVRGDGRIGEYVFGSSLKRRLLTAEAVDVEGLERLGARGVRLVGSDTTRIYCFPTCPHARRITPAHRVPFRSGPDAESEGYRPCQHCRPTAAAV